MALILETLPKCLPSDRPRRWRCCQEHLLILPQHVLDMNFYNRNQRRCRCYIISSHAQSSRYQLTCYPVSCSIGSELHRPCSQMLLSQQTLSCTLPAAYILRHSSARVRIWPTKLPSAACGTGPHMTSRGHSLIPRPMYSTMAIERPQSEICKNI